MATTRRRVLIWLGRGLGFLVSAGWLVNMLVPRRNSMKKRPVQSAAASMREVRQILRLGPKHWVGDGFHVHRVFSPDLIDAQLLSPFVLMDYASPREFPPTDRKLGVGEHPHRGFETVTFAFQGSVAHRDSYGGGGVIGPGDIQWMTAASGVVHEEFHSEDFARAGGTFEMVQLWVNLPADKKMTTPRYQALLHDTFPQVALGAGSARLMAGQLGEAKGPAKVHSPITMFDVVFEEGGVSEFTLPEDHTVLALVARGQVRVADRDVVAPALVAYQRDASGSVVLDGTQDSHVLVLSGQPLNEPVVAHGPFVMNTRDEIVEAIQDFQAGRMGTLRPEG